MKTQNNLIEKALKLQSRGRIEEAGQLFRRVLASDPKNVVALYSLGLMSVNNGDYKEALDFADRCITNSKGHHLIWLLHATIMEKLGRDEEALKSYRNALEVEPNYLEALINMSVFLFRKRRYVDALQNVEKALKIDPKHDKAVANRGKLLEILKQTDKSIETYQYLLNISPDYEYARGWLCYAKLHYCDWRNYENELKAIIEGIRFDKRVCEPRTLLHIHDSAEDQLRCTKLFADRWYPKKATALWQGEQYRHERIRVAYVSADFREHPVGQLMAGIVERHDRSRFEIIGISIGADDGSVLRSRFEKGFERFIDAIDMHPSAIAEMIRTLEVDVLVDLGGYTGDARPDIFAFRPAPVQINFLGYPATMGTDYMDYILVDHQVIPESDRRFYTENVFYLPNTCLPTDAELSVAAQTPSRAELGLPSSGFVFCSFNQDHKINPRIFDVWMRILARVDGSVLWLMMRNEATRDNLRKEAEKRGIDPSRLVFASRVPAQEDHLVRYRLADLFLDTTPYNAHTTAADALFVGLPVLTCMGHSYVSRVAGSLLTAIGLPDLITHSLANYENTAVRLAGDTELLCSIRKRLAENKAKYPLFDTDGFCRDLEKAYTEILSERLGQVSPAHVPDFRTPLSEFRDTAVRVDGGAGLVPAAEGALPPFDQARGEPASVAGEAEPSAAEQRIGTPGEGERSLPEASNTPSTAALLQSAVELHLSDQYQGAHDLYKLILSQEPANVHALHLLGVLLLQNGFDEQGRSYIGQALALRRNYPEALANLSTLSGSVAANRQNWRDSIAIQPRCWPDYETDSTDRWRHRRMLDFAACFKDEASSWLTVGDDCGHVSIMLREQGIGNVVASSLDPGLLKLGHDAGFIGNYLEIDAERISLADDSFDYVLCKEALHRLPRPMLAIYEMLRVARKGVFLIEPRDPVIDWPATKNGASWHEIDGNRISFGLRGQEEPVGTLQVDRYDYEAGSFSYVYTLSQREIGKLCQGLGLPAYGLKGFNDYYDREWARQPANPGSEGFRQTVEQIHRWDQVSAVSGKPTGYLAAILFRQFPSPELTEKLHGLGYAITRAPTRSLPIVWPIDDQLKVRVE
jgi:protein O-GlcNAc transferase